MATKKKPTAAQLAARKLFAARAKAGTLNKKRSPSRDYSRDAAVEREEAALRIAKKHAARKKNPAPKVKRVTVRAKAERDPHLYIVWTTDSLGNPYNDIAKFRKISDAKNYAQSYADQYGVQLAVTSKKL